MQPCFKFTAKAGDKPAVLAIDDEIGFWGVQAKDFRAALDAVEGDNLRVEVNSVGGDVFAGLGMYNMLRSWASEGKTITTRVTGLAASIASVIMLAGDRREMPKNALAMVHSPMTIAGGTEQDLRDAADTLAKIAGSMRGIYMDRMGIDEAKATEIMAKDTWLTADESLALGFVTDITDEVKATAKYDLAKLDLPAGSTLFSAKAPEPKVDPAHKTDPEPDTRPLSEQIEAKAKAAGVGDHAPLFAVACTTLADAEARINAAVEITALCRLANQPTAAAAAIKVNKPVAEVRAALVEAMAKADPDIDNAPPPKPAASSSNTYSPTAIWQKHRAQQPRKGR